MIHTFSEYLKAKPRLYRETKRNQNISGLRPWALLTILSIFISSVSWGQKYTSEWTTKNIRIDGDNNDWDGFSRFHNDNLNISYDIKNDKANLYLVVEISDRMLQLNMLQEGMIISLKVKTQPVLLSTVSFLPLLPQDNDSGNTKPLPAELSQLRAKAAGFRMPEDIAAGEDKDGLVYAVNKDDMGTLIYEVRIPLEALFGQGYNFTNAAGNNIVFNVTSNAFAMNTMSLPKQHKSSGDEEMSEGGMETSMPAGGMNGGMGGGMPGGMGGGMRGTMASGGADDFTAARKSSGKSMNFKFKLGIPKASSVQPVGYRK